MISSIPKNLTGKALIDYVVKNKHLLIAEKKQEMKKADDFQMRSSLFVNDKGEITKESVPVAPDATKLSANLVINTTNWLDSHRDVHIPGLWKKSLSEMKDMYLLKEHKWAFENVITDKVRAFTKKLAWKDLGYDANGETEALMFNCDIDADRNPFMFDQYRKGYVKNHSVGMVYVKISLAVNDKEWKEEFAVWQEYIDQIINKEDAENIGYFWAVKEAKCMEGSAVLRGSNRITPVYSIEESKGLGTEEQPPQGTEEQPQSSKSGSAINWNKIANHLSTI